MDKHGRIVDCRDYFVSNGKVTVDTQREEEYTKALGERIVEEFHKINRVFSSHLVAFAAFNLIRDSNKKLDLFTLLKLPEEDISISYDTFREGCIRLLEQINVLRAAGQLHMAPHLNRDIEEIIDHGLKNVGMYHAKRPLLRTKDNKILTEDMNLLYYYHNRLQGYGLEKLFKG